MVREGLLQDPRGVVARPPPRRSPAPTGSWPRSTTPTPTRAPRRPSRRSPRPTTSSATPTKRKEYDEVRTPGPGGRRLRRRRFAGRLRRPGGGTFRVEDMGDLGDLFGGLFGRGRRGGRRPAGPQRGADVETELHLSFEDAVQRGHHLGQPHHRRPLPHLPRHRAAPGTQPDHLPPLRRHRRAPGQPGPVLPQPDLPAVQRAGHDRRPPLPDLLGHRGRAPQPLGQGAHPRRRGGRPAHPGQGPRGGRAGRRPGRRPLRGRPGRTGTACSAARGRNLTLTVPVTFPEAALGTTLTVPTLERAGHPAGAGRDPVGPDLPGQGPRACPAGKKSATGDLLVTVEVAVPERADRRAAGRGGGAWPTVIEPPAPRRRWGCEMSRRTEHDPGRLRDLGGRRAGRGAPPDPAGLRAQGPARPEPHPGRQPALLASRTSTGSARSRSLTNAGPQPRGVRRVLELEAEVARLHARARGHPGRGPRGGGRDPPPVPPGPGAAVARRPCPTRHEPPTTAARRTEVAR